MGTRKIQWCSPVYTPSNTVLYTVLGGMHTGATWRTPLNRPCAAAMRSFCQITLTTCFTYLYTLIFIGTIAT